MRILNGHADGNVTRHGFCEFLVIGCSIGCRHIGMNGNSTIDILEGDNNRRTILLVAELLLIVLTVIVP